MIDSLIGSVESQGIFAQIAFCAGLTLIALMAAKFTIVRPWHKLVTSTEAEWDDLIFASFKSRLYFFVILGCTHLSMRWINGPDSELIVTLTPFFSVTYIILTTTIASVIVYYLTPVLMERYANKSSVTVSGGNPLISFFLRGVIWLSGFLLALNELEIELVGLMASLALFSLILGFAMQQTIGNIMNSFMLAIDRPFEVGDRIEVEGVLGSVVSVGILSTKILTREEKLVVIPNNTLVESTLVNHARGGGDGMARRISLVLDIGVDYREDIAHVKYTLLNVAKDCPYVIKSPKPVVLLTELGDYSKMFKLFSWVKDYTDELIARDWLLSEIDERFATENIVIPYPIAVKLDELQSDTPDKSKASRQRVAKAQMTKVDNKQQKERKKSKSRVEEIKKLLKNPDLEKNEVEELENEVRSLENALAMFEVDDD
ncbi:MAG TPA: mechanosensitive ion channel family protein [Candidatus Poseidoniales archaeon]|nr:mechanosensitive ion channel family protein [Candidatus Poseidoniales archaeon]